MSPTQASLVRATLNSLSARSSGRIHWDHGAPVEWVGAGMQRLYMDATATTPLLPEVLEAMRPFLLSQFGNPSSIHQEGQQARAAVERARASVARFLSCQPAE